LNQFLTIDSHDNCLPAFQALNYYLSHTDTRTPFEIGHNSPVDFYTWLEAHPIQGGAFHRFMEVQFSMLPSWLSVVDFAAEHAHDAIPETPLFVDVGGGNGQQVCSFRVLESFGNIKKQILNRYRLLH